MPAYVRWRHGILDRTQHDYQRHPTSLFYDDPQCQAVFRRAVATVIGRVNSLTGVPYVREPAILGWELANEPRCEGPGGDQLLQKWVASTADFVRELDPNHLVTVGLEGFYGPSTPELRAHNPYESASRHGADFAAIFAHPSLDFACIHLYPDQWSPLDSSAEQLASFIRSWITSHTMLCAGAKLRKPLVLSEFGKRNPNSYHGRDCACNLEREAAFREVLDCCRGLATKGGPLAGVCAWMLAARQYPDYDGYTLQLGQPAVAPEPTGPVQEPELELEPAAAAAAAEGCEACVSTPGGGVRPFGGDTAAQYPPQQVEEHAVQLLRQYGEAMARLCAGVAEEVAAPGNGRKEEGGAAPAPLSLSAAPTRREGGGLLRTMLCGCFGRPAGCGPAPA
ncbi:hypothetical protein PLESTB_001559100 [Pleodorina starrii]|uniref:mannan endo-1,4-beta-mannosidase n=1 Tax=Pleodorina starrii TaxID=330485 RepID=A0A9W6F886_9CHLO|nr:hypothetical protein PLESTB_001559100 [Pleodorina starrii]GLC72804.1 hypothetical protein PLESTF_001294900 [Pleodorina starrii]